MTAAPAIDRASIIGWTVIVVAGIAAPFVLPEFALNTLILFFIWAITAQSWNLVWGIAGIWSLGQMAIFAMAGYCTGWLVLHVGMSPYFAVVLGVISAVAASILMALPALRLKGVYVILLTISFHEIFRILLSTDTTGFTGGGFGLPHFAGFVPEDWGLERKILLQYYMSLILFVCVSVGILWILRSKLGLAFRAVGQAPMYAASRGVDLFATQVAAFAVSGLMAGLAGAFYAQYFGTMHPGILSYDRLVTVLAMIAIGGWGTFSGPIAGAFVLVWLSELLHEAQQYRMLIFGGAIVLVSVLLPGGIVFPAIRLGRWLVVGRRHGDAE